MPPNLQDTTCASVVCSWDGRSFMLAHVCLFWQYTGGVYCVFCGVQLRTVNYAPR